MPVSWHYLPAELRQQVFDEIVKENVRLTWYSSVSREWQAFFEPKIFHTVRLSQSDFDPAFFDFESVFTPYRIALVRKLWLHIDLPRYNCPDCDECEDEETIRRYGSRRFSFTYSGAD